MSWYRECRCSLRLHGRRNCMALPHQYRLHTPHIWEGKTELSSPHGVARMVLASADLVSIHLGGRDTTLFWSLSCFIEIRVRRTTVKVFPLPSLPPSSLPSLELVLFLLNLVCYVYGESQRCTLLLCARVLQPNAASHKQRWPPYACRELWASTSVLQIVGFPCLFLYLLYLWSKGWTLFIIINMLGLPLYFLQCDINGAVFTASSNKFIAG